MANSNPKMWRGGDGNTLFQSHSKSEDQKAVVMDKEAFSSYVKKFELEPVWLMIAERSVWPRGSNREFCGRRSEGVIWLEGDDWKSVKWNKDTKR